MFLKCVERMIYEPNGSVGKDTHEEDLIKDLKHANQENSLLIDELYYMYGNLADVLYAEPSAEECESLAEERVESLAEEREEDNEVLSDLESFRTSFVDRIHDLQDELNVRSGSIDLSDMTERERELLDQYLLDGIDPLEGEKAGVEVITESYEKAMEERRGV